MCLLAVRLIGSLRPPSILSLITSDPDRVPCDKPCLFGIRPGMTSIADAVRMLHLHPLTRDATWQDDHTLQLTGPDADVAFSQTPDGMVDSIVLTDNPTDTGLAISGSFAGSYALGDYILAFGALGVGIPDSDVFVTGNEAIGTQAVVARPNDSKGRIRPTTPLSMFIISVVGSCPTDHFPMTVHHWRGFKTFLQYYTDTDTYTLPGRISGVPLPPFAACQQ